MYHSEMERLNYQHLERFWAVVREGGVTRASQKLHVSQPTVSAQLRSLEGSLGRKLFVRSGRGLVLTDFGRSIYRYANEIFALGRDLMNTAQGRAVGGAMQLTAGVANVVPKLIAYRILEPALRLPEAVRLECRGASSQGSGRRRSAIARGADARGQVGPETRSREAGA